MLEDRVLVWRFNHGDPAALCRIYEKYRAPLLKVAAALLHDRSSTEDVLHDVFEDFAEMTGPGNAEGRGLLPTRGPRTPACNVRLLSDPGFRDRGHT